MLNNSLGSSLHSGDKKQALFTITPFVKSCRRLEVHAVVYSFTPSNRSTLAFRHCSDVLDPGDSPDSSYSAAMALCVSAIVFRVPPISVAMSAITFSSPIASLSYGASFSLAGASGRAVPTIPLLGKSITPELLLAKGASITGTVVSNKALTTSLFLTDGCSGSVFACAAVIRRQSTSVLAPSLEVARSPVTSRRGRS